jgi:integrase
MPKKHLTDRFISSVRNAGPKNVEYYDTMVPGLSLRIGTGGSKSWNISYTRPQTNTRTRSTLGRYPQTTLAKARERAVKVRARIAAGEDPNRRNAVDHAGRTIRDLFEDYMQRHVRPNLRTAEAVERRFSKNVLPEIGSVKIREFHRSDLVWILDKIVDRGAPVEANRVFEDARAMIRWAIGRGYLDYDPISMMKRPTKPKSRNRILTYAELTTLWSGFDTAPMSFNTMTILKLAIVTGQRIGEIAGAAIEEFDFDERVWRIPETRVKNRMQHDVPLTALGSDIGFEAIERARSLRPETRWLFGKPRVDVDEPMFAQAVSTAVRRSQAHFGLPHWTCP